MLVILAAGVAKLADIHAFRTSLETWVLLPGWTRDPVSIAVPVLEVTLGVCWLFAFERARVARLAWIQLAVFTAAYMTHWVLIRPPDCQCLGKLMAFEHERSNAVWTVCRNVLLMLGLTPWILGRRDRTPPPSAAPRGGAPVEPAPARPGFTLVELLVVIAVSAALIGVSMTGLSRAKSQAKVNQSLARFASAQRGLAAYSADFKDAHPIVMSPTTRRLEFKERGFDVRVRYFEQFTYWHYFLAGSYLNLPWDSPSLQATGNLGGIATSIWYSHTFISSPELWSEYVPPAGATRRATRASEVQYPSSKISFVLAPGMGLFPTASEAAPTMLIYAACDGSAAVAPAQGLIAGMLPPEDAIGDGAPSLRWPGMGTVGGLHGRDVRR